jgi:hypothetical protein
MLELIIDIGLVILAIIAAIIALIVALVVGPYVRRALLRGLESVSDTLITRSDYQSKFAHIDGWSVRLIAKEAMMSAEIIVASIAAASQAIQTWMNLHDRSLALKAAARTLEERSDSYETKDQAEQLAELIPKDVLATMKDRVRTCWDMYHQVLKGDEAFLPGEVDKATDALKACICRELRRIHDLSRGRIPPGDLSDWFEAYCRH